jgi:hypothetical protein
LAGVVTPLGDFVNGMRDQLKKVEESTKDMPGIFQGLGKLEENLRKLEDNADLLVRAAADVKAVMHRQSELTDTTSHHISTQGPEFEETKTEISKINGMLRTQKDQLELMASKEELESRMKLLDVCSKRMDDMEPLQSEMGKMKHILGMDDDGKEETDERNKIKDTVVAFVNEKILDVRRGATGIDERLRVLIKTGDELNDSKITETNKRIESLQLALESSRTEEDGGAAGGASGSAAKTSLPAGRGRGRGVNQKGVDVSAAKPRYMDPRNVEPKKANMDDDTLSPDLPTIHLETPPELPQSGGIPRPTTIADYLSRQFAL